MLQIVGKPIIEHIVEYLRSFGIFDIILTTNYLRENVITHLGYGERFGVNISYPLEDDPLGTAGSVKNIQHLLTETFLVMQGDNITDFDLNSLIRFHRKSGGLATMAVHPVPDPEHYGVVVSDERGQVRFFQEKPAPSDCRSSLVNTGIYVLEPEVLNYIPPNTKFDFSRNLFPVLCGMEMLYACPFDGFWTDVGQPKGFNEAKCFMLNKMEYMIAPSATVFGKLEGNVVVGEGAYIGKKSVVYGPTTIGENTVIEENCVIGPKTCMGSNLVVKEGTHVIDATLFDGTELGRDTALNGTVIADDCSVGANSSILEHSILGSNCTLGLSVVVDRGARIWPNVSISHNSEVSGEIRTFWQTQDVKYKPSWALRNLSSDEAFYFNKQEDGFVRHTGYVAKSIIDFNDIVHQVELSSIGFHFRHDVNDFAEWARRIIGDPVFAQGFDRIKSHSAGLYIESVRREIIAKTTSRINALKKSL
jgi:NDP-sugar pyrophosphorylase family protein